MPLQFNPKRCTPKKRCCATNTAYDPVDPCSLSNEVFNPATCECEANIPSRICAQGIRGFYGFGERDYSFDLDLDYPSAAGTIEFTYTAGVPKDNGQVLPSDDAITFILSGVVDMTIVQSCFGCSETIFFPKGPDDDIFDVRVVTQPDTGQPRNGWGFDFLYYCTPVAE